MESEANFELSGEVLNEHSASPLQQLTIPLTSSFSRSKPKSIKHKPKDQLLLKAKALTTITEQQTRLAVSAPKKDREESFAEYIALSLKSINDEKVRRRVEFRIHSVLFEVMTEEDRRGNNLPNLNLPYSPSAVITPQIAALQVNFFKIYIILYKIKFNNL